MSDTQNVILITAAIMIMAAISMSIIEPDIETYIDGLYFVICTLSTVSAPSLQRKINKTSDTWIEILITGAIMIMTAISLSIIEPDLTDFILLFYSL